MRYGLGGSLLCGSWNEQPENHRIEPHTPQVYYVTPSSLMTFYTSAIRQCHCHVKKITDLQDHNVGMRLGVSACRSSFFFSLLKMNACIELDYSEL